MTIMIDTSKPSLKGSWEGASLCALAGLAGTMGHSLAFDSQVSPVLNTYVSSWAAGIFMVQGLHLLYCILRSDFYVSAAFFYGCDLAFLTWFGITDFICIVCYGLLKDWSSFAWAVMTLILLAAIMVWIVKSRVPRDQQDDVATDVPKPSETRPPLKIRLAAITATTIKVITAFVMGLLAAGAISSALAFSYPAPGRSVSVFFEGANQNGSLALYCIGETIPSRPIVFLVATSAHGIVDFYRVQHNLNSLNGTNRRVCSYDNLGVGWSQDLFKGQFTNYEFLHSLMLSSGEPAPWHIIGWGG